MLLKYHYSWKYNIYKFNNIFIIKKWTHMYILPLVKNNGNKTEPKTLIQLKLFFSKIKYINQKV